MAYTLADCVSNSEGYSNSSCALPDSFRYLDNDSRHIFYGTFITLAILSLGLNVGAIYTIIKRKYRCVQKACIISLALSDTLATLSNGINCIAAFTDELLIWKLGSFMCSFIPMAQMAAILASSIALMLIAIDRYKNVVNALSKRWDPRLSFCLTGVAILWIFSFVVTSPLYDYFVEKPVGIIFFDGQNLEIKPYKVCVSFKKVQIRTYYIAMTLMIFLPLLLIFVWAYYKIAALIWKHRKPFSTIFNKNNETDHENSVSNTKITEISKTSTSNSKTTINKSRDIRVERKIRSFKIIVALTVVFILCRLPYFTMYLYKLALPNQSSTHTVWVLNYTFIALHLVNCALNPLLYTFLNQTLKFLVHMEKLLSNFIWEICCFCFSNGEFDAFEKENPFVVENYEQKEAKPHRNSRVKFEQPCKADTNMSGTSTQPLDKY